MVPTFLNSRVSDDFGAEDPLLGVFGVSELTKVRAKDRLATRGIRKREGEIESMG